MHPVGDEKAATRNLRLKTCFFDVVMKVLNFIVFGVLIYGLVKKLIMTHIRRSR